MSVRFFTFYIHRSAEKKTNYLRKLLLCPSVSSGDLWVNFVLFSFHFFLGGVEKILDFPFLGLISFIQFHFCTYFPCLFKVFLCVCVFLFSWFFVCFDTKFVRWSLVLGMCVSAVPQKNVVPLIGFINKNFLLIFHHSHLVHLLLHLSLPVTDTHTRHV